MSADQVAKLRSELDVVQTNAEVFGEMLITLQPGEEDPQDFELLMVKNELMIALSNFSFPRNYIIHANKCKLALLIYLLKYQLMI
jgi:hypothetical protein